MINKNEKRTLTDEQIENLSYADLRAAWKSENNTAIREFFDTNFYWTSRSYVENKLGKISDEDWKRVIADYDVIDTVVRDTITEVINHNN